MQIQKTPVDQFVELIQRCIEAWCQAAELARAEISKDPEWAEKVCEKAPTLFTPHTVRRFANIGVKYVPQLVIGDAPGAKALRKLPLKVQEQYVSSPLPLLIKSESGWETLQVDLHNLTADQAAQVFACDHVRDEAEQRAWIEDRKAKQAAPPLKVNLPYRIVRDEVVFMAGARMKRKELAKLLAEMES